MYQNKILKGLITPIIIIALSQSAFALQDSSEVISIDKEKKSITKKKKKKTKIEKHIVYGYGEIGFGYDSNPYLTPNKSYYDYTNTGGGALVEPDVKSGMFVPVLLKGGYEYRLEQDIRLLGDVRFSGKYFYDKELENANDYKSQARLGVRFRLNKYKREINNIEVKAFVGNVYEIYVDHDDGSLKTTIGGDQSNRYQYKKVGAELTYKYDFKKVDFLFLAKYENRDYEEPDSWSSLDHAYIKFKAEAGYQLTKQLHFGGHYQYSLRDYKERKSYEIAADGNISLTKPGVNYTYNDIKLFGSYKFSKSYKMGLKYLLSSREDNNQGYSDYLYHGISWKNSYRVSKALKTSLKLKYYTYNYKNAYAYDNDTTLPKKESYGYKADFDTKYRFNVNWIGNLNLRYQQANSTDKRYEYNEMIAMALIKYRL